MRIGRLEEIIELVPDPRFGGVALERCGGDGPRFLAYTPSDDLKLEAALPGGAHRLHVDAGRQRDHALRQQLGAVVGLCARGEEVRVDCPVGLRLVGNAQLSVVEGLLGFLVTLGAQPLLH